MEKKLHHLFDYQKFRKNPQLDAMLSDAEERYEGVLSDDDLEFVSAAGDSKPTILPMVVMGQENDP